MRTAGISDCAPEKNDTLHIGSVEISVSMNSVIDEFSDRFNETTQFIILKSQVMKKVIGSEITNYLPWFLDDRYLMDRDLSEVCFLKDVISNDDAEKISRAITADSGSGRPFSLIMIDVDHFKKVNDVFGHSSGDLVLMGIAAVMKKNIRKTDLIGRYGGEEFIVLLPETSGEEAAVVAEKIREMVSSHSFQRIGVVTVSCGVANISDQIKDVDSVIKNADRNLYKAKRDGRNKVVC